jgi:hypothetical protein
VLFKKLIITPARVESENPPGSRIDSILTVRAIEKTSLRERAPRQPIAEFRL